MAEKDRSGEHMSKIPGLTQLEATAEILRLLLEEVTEDETNWKPAPDRFSIAEVLEHLSHTEGHCFRGRVQDMVEQDIPAIGVYDQNALHAAGQYSGRSAEDSFDHFEEQREDNIEYLRNLPVGALTRVGMHVEYGPISVAQLLNEWAFHDLGHVRQIAEIVRAQKYFPQMGPLAQEYKVNP